MLVVIYRDQKLIDARTEALVSDLALNWIGPPYFWWCLHACMQISILHLLYLGQHPLFRIHLVYCFPFSFFLEKRLNYQFLIGFLTYRTTQNIILLLLSKMKLIFSKDYINYNNLDNEVGSKLEQDNYIIQYVCIKKELIEK